ncbi:MAG: acryloyl-CoA reductase [Gammaproteobacteria bacterium]|nr:acryloyl-CoA reductase [Gammaproteobacteria bacterium]
MKCRALLVEQSHSQPSASIQLRDTPVLKTGGVLIEVHYSSLNYKDALALTGHAGIMRHYPMVAGIDAAGIVIESASSSFNAGDAVIVTGYGMSQSHDGGYTDYLQVPAEWVVALPPGLNLYEAMSLGTAGYTAALSIQRMQDNAQTPAMGPIIVTGATGGVGSFAINMLAGLNFEVIALSGKLDQYQDYLRELGASECLDRLAINPGRKTLQRALWGGAVDSLGGEVLAWLLQTVRPYGNIAACGLAMGAELQSSVMPFIIRGVSLLGIASAESAMPIRQKIWQRLTTDLKPGKIETIVSGLIHLDEVVGVAEKMLAGETQGRYVVKLKE